MNLSEKIMMLRKKEGWSQEELANHLQISRQAVSKWESGQSMPDTDKIIQLSQLFHVTTDYLLLDQENEGNIQTEIYLSLTQVQEYLKIRKQSSLKIAFATFLCVISPIPLIGFTTLCQYQRFYMAENLAISIGLSFLIICITIAVILFCLCAFKVKKYDFLEKEDFSLENSVKEYAVKEKEAYQNHYHRYQILGISLCILSVLPIFIFLNYEFLESIAVCFLLLFVSIGCFFLVLAGTYQNALDKILQTGDYTPEQKKKNALKSKISAIYWLVVTAIFLYYTFGKNGNGQMQYSWIIWAIAGVLFGVVMIIIDLIIQGLIILFVFYLCYFMKMFQQRKQGIQTDHMGKGKQGIQKKIEILMKTATILTFIVEIISIYFNTTAFPLIIRIIGMVLGILGNIIFIVSVLTMKEAGALE